MRRRRDAGWSAGMIAPLRPHGMDRALLAAALARTSVAAIAMVAGLGHPRSGPLELALLNGFLVALFLASAWLFRRAAPGANSA